MLNELPTERVTAALRFSLQEAHMSQETLAKRVGLSFSALNRRLAGQTPITLKDLDRIADALNLDVRVSLIERSSHGSAAA